MTLDEFLDDYVPRVLKPMGGWTIDECGYLRRITPDAVTCPLTAERGTDPGFWYAGPLGDTDDACRIVAAADKRHQFSRAYFRPKVRARLLAGLGLQEG